MFELSLLAGDILVFLTGQAEIDKAIARINDAIRGMPAGECGPLIALPLYASLPPDMQVHDTLLPQKWTPSRCFVLLCINEHVWRRINAGFVTRCPAARRRSVCF